MYDILTSLPYQKVMTNNINLDESFNSFETSIAKTLNSSSNTAFFYLKSAVSENEMNMAKVIYSLLKMYNTVHITAHSSINYLNSMQIC